MLLVVVVLLVLVVLVVLLVLLVRWCWFWCLWWWWWWWWCCCCCCCCCWWSCCSCSCSCSCSCCCPPLSPHRCPALRVRGRGQEGPGGQLAEALARPPPALAAAAEARLPRVAVLGSPAGAIFALTAPAASPPPAGGAARGGAGGGGAAAAEAAAANAEKAGWGSGDTALVCSRGPSSAPSLPIDSVTNST